VDLAWSAVEEALDALGVHPPIPLRELFLGGASDGLDGEWTGLLRVAQAKEQLVEERRAVEQVRLRAAAAAAEYGGGAGDALDAEAVAGGSRGTPIEAAGAQGQADVIVDVDTAVLPVEAAPVDGIMFDTGGVLVHSVSDRVTMGEGRVRMCLLALLHLYRCIPQLVPRQTIRFEARLGVRAERSIELSNPSSKPVIYEVSVVAEPGDEDVFEADSTRLTLPPGKSASLRVFASARLSRPASARITLRSQRNGPVQAMTLVFLLVTRVVERPPVEVVQLRAPMYRAVEHELQVTNPFDREGKFRVRLIPIPPTAPVGRNVPTYDEDGGGKVTKASHANTSAAAGGSGSRAATAAGSRGSGTPGRATSAARQANIAGKSGPGVSARRA